MTKIKIISIYSAQKNKQNYLLVDYLSVKRQKSFTFFTITLKLFSDILLLTKF